VYKMAKGVKPAKNWTPELKKKAAKKKELKAAEEAKKFAATALQKSKKEAERAKESYAKTVKRNSKKTKKDGQPQDRTAGQKSTKLVPKDKNPWINKTPTTVLHPNVKLMALKAAKNECEKLFTLTRDRCNVMMGGKGAAAAIANAELKKAQAALDHAALAINTKKVTKKAVDKEAKSEDWPKKPKERVGEGALPGSTGKKRDPKVTAPAPNLDNMGKPKVKKVAKAKPPPPKDIPAACVKMFEVSKKKCEKLWKIAKCHVKLPDPAQVASEQYNKYHAKQAGASKDGKSANEAKKQKAANRGHMAVKGAPPPPSA